MVNILSRAISLTSVALLFFTTAWAQRPALPDFGPNVLVVTPETPIATAQAAIDKAYAVERENEFGDQRYAFLFLPGHYAVNIPLGYYTQVAGAGASPQDVVLTGDVHADASLESNNATTTFWRGIEGVDVQPRNGALGDGNMQWAVSQATFLRRMHIEGNVRLHQKGWASGGWMADTLVDGTTDSGPQQQWMTRNSDFRAWKGANWNIVFVGVPHAPATSWPDPGYTTVDKAPVTREKPFLYVDAHGAWWVRVPELQHDSAGVTWSSGETPGTSLPLSQFYIAHAGKDTAATLNRALAAGKNLLLTPGIYELDAPIRVQRKGTIVLGLGYATLHPTRGNAVLTTADADGIIIAGLLVRAGEPQSPVLMQIGPRGSHAQHAANPISLHDVFFDVGGAVAGSVDVNLEVNANDTIIDHTWIWRADHGNAVGWTRNISHNGLVVNGDDVTAYGLFVEHHQQYQVLWRGERGRTYMYQSEIAYDPPTQAAYTSAPGVDGWASYKVADTVQQHEAWGLGIYSVFTYPGVVLSRAIEVPVRPTVRFHDMITTCLNTHGAIENIIDDKGGAATCVPRHWPRLTQFP